MTTSDLQSIQKTIFAARSKWYSLGIELSIDPNDLDAVKEKHQNDPDKCFREILTIWLRGNYSKRTWITIAKALLAKSVGFGELAERVGELSHARNADEEKACGGDDTDDVFHCPCRECSLDSYLSNGCPRLRLNSYPYLELGKLDEDDREDLIQKLSHETGEIVESFATLMNETCESLQKNDLQIQTLIRCALSLGAYKSQKVQNPLSEEHERELRNAKTMDDVFIILRPHMSFFNYELLEYIIKRHGSDENRKLLEVYLQKFNVFCRRKVFEVSPDAIGNTSASKRKRKMFAVLLTAAEYGDKPTLMDIKEAKRKLATLLKLNASSLHLHRIDEGSLILIFSVPTFLSTEIFPLNSSQIDCLKAEGYRIFVPVQDCNVYLPDDQDKEILQEHFKYHYDVEDSTDVQKSVRYINTDSNQKELDEKTDIDPTDHPTHTVNHPNQDLLTESQPCHSCDENSLVNSASTASYQQDLVPAEQIAVMKKKRVLKDDIASGTFECFICQNILQNPQCVSCCSSRFCKRCIEVVQLGEEPLCPSCGSVFDVVGADSVMEQRLHSIHIPCIYAYLGCDWQGELAKLDDHIGNDVSHTGERIFQGCQYIEITCKYCCFSIRRSNMNFHQTHQCSKRPFTCEYCGEFTSSYEEVTNNHLPLCDMFPVECSNGCGESFRRCDIESHISENCSCTIIDCALKEEGCNVQLPRIDMRAHLLTHVRLQKLQTALSKANEYHEQVVRKEAQTLALVKTLQVCGYKFAEPIPESFPFICPVCLNFLQDPYQATCCGKNFCKECTKRIESENKSCPLCKQIFETFFNKGHKQQLVQLKVFCKHFNSGCIWKGELGDLDKHLNIDPVEDKQLEGCQFTEIHCLYCSKLYERNKIDKHQNSECLKRRFSCEYCTYTSTYDDVTSNHLQICGNYPIHCPNNCGKVLQRQNVDSHKTRECELQPIIFKCDFQCGDYGEYRVSGLPSQSVQTDIVSIECTECMRHLDNLRDQQHVLDLCPEAYNSDAWVRLKAPRAEISIYYTLTGCYHFDQVLCTFCKRSINHDDVCHHERNTCPERPQMKKGLQYEDVKG